MIEEFLELRRVSDILYDLQKIRISTANRLRTLPKETYGIYPRTLEKLENELTKRLEKILEEIPVWNEWLKGIKGVGPRIASTLLGRTAVEYKELQSLDGLNDLQKKYSVAMTKNGKRVYMAPVYRGIEAFPTVSKLWKYMLLDVREGRAPVREKGKKLGGCLLLKTTVVGKLVPEFLKVAKGGEYEQLYRKQKSYYLARFAEIIKNPKLCPRYEECIKKLTGKAERVGRVAKKPSCKGHIENMTRRYVGKEFVKDLWIHWREVEGLPVVPTYWEEKCQKGNENHKRSASHSLFVTQRHVAGQ
jgi:hypothetical protein